MRRLVLVGASAGIGRSLPVFPRLWGNAITGPLIRRLRITDAETLRKRVYAPLLVAHPEEVPLELLAMDIAAAALSGVDCLLHDSASRHHLARVPAEPDDAGGAGRLGVPTLFVWGDSDAFAPPSSGRDMAASMPEAAIEMTPDTGHLPHLERPDTGSAESSCGKPW